MRLRLGPCMRRDDCEVLRWWASVSQPGDYWLGDMPHRIGLDVSFGLEPLEEAGQVPPCGEDGGRSASLRHRTQVVLEVAASDL